MPKLKTKKIVAKRIKVTGKKGKNAGKLVHQTGGKGRYNAKERSKTRMAKRRDKQSTGKTGKNLRRMIPYA